MEKKTTDLIQIFLPDNSLIILTEDEFLKAVRRGNIVMLNRKGKMRLNIPGPYLEALEVQNA